MIIILMEPPRGIVVGGLLNKVLTGVSIDSDTKSFMTKLWLWFWYCMNILFYCTNSWKIYLAPYSDENFFHQLRKHTNQCGKKPQYEDQKV